MHANAKHGRENIRHLPLVTIDGADARDFEDAVYCEPASSGWRLFVAIADVARYVERRSALDEEARNRGTSVYFTRRLAHGGMAQADRSLAGRSRSLRDRDLDRRCPVAGAGSALGQGQNDVGVPGDVQPQRFVFIHFARLDVDPR